MPYINCFVDPRTLEVLNHLSVTQNKSVEQIVEAIIESEAISHLPGGMRHMHFDRPHRDDRYELICGGVGTGFYARDGDVFDVTP